jgi:hypothetical protein
MASEIDPQVYQKFLFKKSPTAQITEDMRALMQHVDNSLLPSIPKPKPSKSKDSCFYCRSDTSVKYADA